MTIGLLYIGLLVLGVVYAVISGALGWFSDLGHADIHIDASGHIDAGTAHPISGTTIATFITGFGAGGTMAHYAFELSRLAGIGVATLSGFALAAAAFGVLELIFKQTQAGSEFREQELVGREGEVITAIPENGVGEIACLVRGQREQVSARSAGGVAIPKGRLVVIEKTTGPTTWVRAKD